MKLTGPETGYPNPPFCAACYGQKPEMRHVDFEAAYDGPVVNPEDDIKMAVDDLILCEECLRSAAQRLGYGPIDSDYQNQLEDRLLSALDRATKAEGRLQVVREALQPTTEEITATEVEPRPRRRGRPPKVQA